MKQQVSPVAIIVVVVVVGAIIAFFAYRTFGNPAGAMAGAKPPGMPPAVQAEFQRRLGGVTGPGQASSQRTPVMPGVPIGPPGRP